MSDLMYFDCNVTVGQRQRKHPLARWSTEHLLDDMALAEVSGALIVHGVARTYDACHGNGRLMPELQKAPDRLFGVWCLAPIGDPGYYQTGDELMRAIQATLIGQVPFRVRNEKGEEVAKGMSGDEVELPAGPYVVAVELPGGTLEAQAWVHQDRVTRIRVR